MTRSFAAALRRTQRLMRQGKLAKAGQSMQAAMTGLVVKAVGSAVQNSATTRKAKVGRSLGSVIAKLRAASLLPRVDPAKSASPAPRIPPGASYEARTHRSAAGSRHYKLFLPTGVGRKPRGLIMMLHGCNQTADDFAAGTHMNAIAGKHGLAVVYPQQTTSANPAGCWNWFRPSDQHRGAGEPAMLASLARKLARRYGLGRNAVFVAGLSAGGAMAAILADTYPEVFSAAGVHSGLARGAARDGVSALSSMRNGAETRSPTSVASKPVRSIIFHGDNDSTVHPDNAALIVASALGRDVAPARRVRRSLRGGGYARNDYPGPDGTIVLELWMLEGAGHAWSGGKPRGSFTDPKGPGASAEMIRFFLQHQR